MTVTRPPTHDADGSVAEAIEREEARLRALETERAEAEARLRRLRVKLVMVDAAENGTPVTEQRGLAAPRSSAEKLRVFRSLFRGRDDLYPTRWVSKKTGKAGYAPACANTFIAGGCVSTARSGTREARRRSAAPNRRMT